MKLTPTTSTTPAKRGISGFTLAEVLAALAFMAIVIPVALQALSISSRAGEVAQRKVVASRIAERLLNEQVVTGTWKSAGQRGTAEDGAITYEWELTSAPWSKDSLQVVTIKVSFNVKGERYEVDLSTLADSTTTANGLAL